MEKKTIRPLKWLIQRMSMEDIFTFLDKLHVKWQITRPTNNSAECKLTPPNGFTYRGTECSPEWAVANAVAQFLLHEERDINEIISQSRYEDNKRQEIARTRKDKAKEHLAANRGAENDKSYLIRKLRKLGGEPSKTLLFEQLLQDGMTDGRIIESVEKLKELGILKEYEGKFVEVRRYGRQGSKSTTL